jgi:P-type Ca2+ transporter type 2C
MSTTVTNGTAIGVVVAVGMNTEIGKIANLLNVATRDYTPLELKLNKLGKQIGLLAIGACVVIFIIGILQNRNVADMFLTAVSLAVAAIPEGLSAIVAIVLAIGVTKMANQKAIVKKLAAVETLGSVNVICTDKTGTLTENKMTVKKFYFQTQITSIDDKKEAEAPQFQRLLRAFVLSSNATYENAVGVGDPTEIALHIFYDGYRNDRIQLIQQTKRLAEYPFDAKRKSMSVLVSENNLNIVYTKGAVVRLFDICSFIAINDKPEPFTDEHKHKIREIANTLSDDALRTLGVAYKMIDQVVAPELFENDLIFLGLVGMFDPPREEVKPVIQQAHQAGIQVIMITGDHKNTAFAIAKTLGIATDLNQVMSGHELEKHQKNGPLLDINHIKVFARVSPEHKVDIVNNLRKAGNIVAMTGDGVNDAPSLSAADIGIAMGKSGTDVARNAADIILTDDNFKTIISAVEKGRNVYQNIKKSILFLLTCNLGEVIAVFITILIGWYPPFIATQLLWINLITDSLPALALGLDNNDKSLMLNKPRPANEHILSGYNKWQVVIGGVLIGAAAITAFYFGCTTRGANPFDKNIPVVTIEYARTLSFMVIIVAQLLFTLSVRSGKQPFLSRPVFDNKLLLFSIVLGFLIQLIILFVPYLRNAFHMQVVTASGWGVILILGFLPLLISEMLKWILFLQSKR